MKKILFFVILLTGLFCISASASKLSPAIDVIASENNFVKASAIQNGEFMFDTADFDMPLHTTVNQITICSLPNSSYGRLMLDNLYVVENQVIKREDFSMLHFVFAGEDVQECFFTFEPNNSGYEIECALKALKSVNFSPVAESSEALSAWTQVDISYYGALDGYDPDGDDLRYEIVSYPQKGLVKITDVANGDYVYTPFANATGLDSFTYRVVDSFGNYSNECKVSVKVQKLRTSLVYNDINESKYHNAILVMAKFDLMESQVSNDGSSSFQPKEEVSREDFLVALMKAMGANNVPCVQKTRFADDLEIDLECKGYVESALSLGIIYGTFENDGLHFYPDRAITLAEASVMINNIIGAKANGTLPTFKDFEEIPIWASDDISILCELGILQKQNGKINPNSPLTKEQTAQILMSLLRYRGKLEQ